MAADVFEMETGEPFTRWIEKHPQLVMQYQPLELTVAAASGFFFPLAMVALGLGLVSYGIYRSLDSGVPVKFLLAGTFIPLALAGLWMMFEKAFWIADNLLARSVVFLFIAGIPVYGFYGCMTYGRPFGYIVLGAVMMAAFGALAVRGVQTYLRALNFKLTLKDGMFHLQHGSHTDTFPANDVTQACVVRPGTVGVLHRRRAAFARTGRMLTLDTCLSDLHALGVVMDLRFRDDFPPSADDIARIRRDNLRKIRGLA